MILQAFKKSQYNFLGKPNTALEFGVFEGGSFASMAQEIKHNYPLTSLIGFDSWEGLPSETEGVWYPDRHKKGSFKSSKYAVLEKLRLLGLRNDPRFQFVDGFFEDSLTEEVRSKISNLSFVNIDVDIHHSTVLILDFIYPLLRPGVVIYFDDWKDPIDKFEGKWGEHLAWEEFIEKHPEVKYSTLEVNQYNQRYLEIE
jgi:predicted O-methyltransferase YrrM